MDRFWALIVILVTSSVPAFNQATNSRVSEKPNQILAQEVVIAGTATLDTTQLEEITADLTARRMNEDDHEVRDRIRDAFQQRGFFDADVTNLKIRLLDPLARPKPVRIEAEVTEGPHFRFAGFKFTGNRGLGAERLRKLLPLQVGEYFSTGKVRSGFASIRNEYMTNGYLDFSLVPKTDKVDDGKLMLTFEVTEGPQYRMGNLDIEGKPELIEKLQPQWKLNAGEPFDAGYLDKFLEGNRTLLPADFEPHRDAYTARDCRDMTVNVRIELDPKRAWQPRPKDVKCDQPKDSTKQTGQ
jgi:outer membrane translocation and assembly module TamA